MTKRIVAATLIAAGIAGAALPANAQSAGQNVDEINAIINDLSPASRERYVDETYVRQIKRIEVPVSVNVTPGTAYDRTIARSTKVYVVNYNHTRDFSVHFPFDQATLTAEAMATLNVLGRALSSPALSQTRYLVGGHTDAVGPADYNWFLSERRAQAVVDYLSANFPIARHRLEPVGFGEELLAVNRPGPSQANRRVEVTLIENAEVLAPAQVSVVEEVTVIPGATTVVAVPETGNVVCETTPVALDDPRPTRHGLDDFGSPRTPVACEDVHAAPVAVETVETVETITTIETVPTPTPAPEPTSGATPQAETETMNDAIN